MIHRHCFRLKLFKTEDVYECNGSFGMAFFRCGISQPTLRKWWRRYESDRVEGLQFRSRRPRRMPFRKVFHPKPRRPHTGCASGNLALGEANSSRILAPYLEIAYRWTLAKPAKDFINTPPLTIALAIKLWPCFLNEQRPIR